MSLCGSVSFVIGWEQLSVVCDWSGAAECTYYGGPLRYWQMTTKCQLIIFLILLKIG